MEKEETPIKQPSFDFEEETEEHRQEMFHRADEGEDEISFDVPRD